ncbi:Ig-like domain-containing protein [Acetobacter estunensis]|uniref:beta strand repeat-containing protein n=1 Tax=Acetobacter estunensis TaxID=104097 RepID=UPI001C2DA128|nr:Ig-like domain-containing protein [Acetobacter estunensis]MBV1838613.1 hypothetical protein [Acetobacter estunensis]
MTLSGSNETITAKGAVSVTVSGKLNNITGAGGNNITIDGDLSSTEISGSGNIINIDGENTYTTDASSANIIYISAGESATITANGDEIFVEKGACATIIGDNNFIYGDLDSTISYSGSDSYINAVYGTVDVNGTASITSSGFFLQDTGCRYGVTDGDSEYATVGGSSLVADSIVTVEQNNIILGTAYVNSDGSWTLNIPVLSKGSQVLIANITNPDGTQENLTTILYSDYVDANPTINIEADTYVAPVFDGPVETAVSTSSSPIVYGSSDPNDLITINIYDPNTNQLIESTTAISGSDGMWSTTLPLLNDGNYEVEATASTPSGDSAGSSREIDIIIDTDAIQLSKNVTIESTGSGISNPTFSGTAEANSLISISDNGKIIGTANVDSTGSWTFQANDLSYGENNIIIENIDKNGIKLSEMNYTYNVTNISTAPSISSINPSTDGNTLILQGTGTAGSVVAITNGDGTLIGNANVSSTGTWNLTVSSSLVDGLNSFYASDAETGASNGMPFYVIYNGSSSSSLPYNVVTLTLSGQTTANFTLENAQNGQLTSLGSLTVSAPYIPGNNASGNVGESVAIITRGSSASSGNILNISTGSSNLYLLSASENGVFINGYESIEAGQTESMVFGMSSTSDIGIHVASNGTKKVYFSGGYNSDGWDNTNNYDALRATGQLGMSLDEQSVANEVSSGHFSQYLSSESNNGNVDVSLSINLEGSSDTPSYLKGLTNYIHLQGGTVSSALENINISSNGGNGSWLYIFNETVNSGWSDGIKTIAPIFSPNYFFQNGDASSIVAGVGGEVDTVSNYSELADSNFYKNLEKAAVYGGALAIDSPADYFINAGLDYQQFVENEIRWAVDQGLQVTVVISGFYDNTEYNTTDTVNDYGQDVRKMVAILEATGAVPTNWEVSEYEAKRTIAAGSDTDPNSEAGIALWLENYAEVSAIKFSSPQLISASFQPDTLTITLKGVSDTSDIILADGQGTTTDPWELGDDDTSWDGSPEVQVYIDQGDKSNYSQEFSSEINVAVGDIKTIDGTTTLTYMGDFSESDSHVYINLMNSNIDSTSSVDRSISIVSAEINGNDLGISSGLGIANMGAVGFNISSSQAEQVVEVSNPDGDGLTYTESFTQNPTIAGYATARDYVQIIDNGQIIATTQVSPDDLIEDSDGEYGVTGYWSITLPDQDQGTYHHYKIEVTTTEVPENENPNNTSAASYVNIYISPDALSSNLVPDSDTGLSSIPTPEITGEYTDEVTITVSEENSLDGVEFQAYVDGNAVGSVQTVTAVNGESEQTFSYAGDFQDGTAHDFALKFLGDASSSSENTGALYIKNISLDGNVVANSSGVTVSSEGYSLFNLGDFNPTLNDFINPTFTGTGVANSTITLQDGNGGNILGTTTVGGDGSWVFTIPQSDTLSSGSHTLYVTDSIPDGATSSATSYQFNIGNT